MSEVVKVPLVSEGLSHTEIEALCSSLRSGAHTMGSEVFNFEQQFSKHFKVGQSVMVNSGSSANLLALEVFTRGMSWKKKADSGGYIAVPAVLWPTTVWPIIQLGFKALVIDTLPGTLEIDFDLLIKAKQELKDKLLGAILIHPLGKSLNMERISELRQSHNMFIIEDNAESLGAGNNGKFAGTAGHFGTFSFYYSHHMTTIEGGMVVTNDETDANDLLSMRAHGWSRNRLDKQDLANSNSEISPDFLFVSSGFNFRPMEIQGVLGTSQLRNLPEFLEKRWKNVEMIVEATQKSTLSLIGSEKIESRPISFKEPIDNSWMAFPLKIKDSKVPKDQVRELFRKAGIATRPILAGNFLDQPAGQHRDIIPFGNLANSRQLYGSAFMVGNHHSFSMEQLELISSTIRLCR
jgi:CDP-6-deoxy-D-xylo-4-hexulose-3-dehydrase